MLRENMAATLELATREIFSQLKTAWDAGAADATGASPAFVVPLLFEDNNWNGRPGDELKTSWGRVYIRHTEAEQATLADDSGKALFCNYGIVTVQVFAPMRDNTAAMVSRRLAKVVKDAFQGKRTPNVWFRGVKYEEQARQGAWYQINVSANFEWNERAT